MLFHCTVTHIYKCNSGNVFLLEVEVAKRKITNNNVTLCTGCNFAFQKQEMEKKDDYFKVI